MAQLFRTCIGLTLAGIFSVASANTTPYSEILPDTYPMVRVLGLQRLERQLLPKGEKELRIWIGFGYGRPDKLVRIQVGTNGAIVGITYLFYDPMHEHPDAEEKAFYDHVHQMCPVINSDEQNQVCLPTGDKGRDWKKLYADLVASAVWSLPDESRLATPLPDVTDGIGMLVETKDGDNYRAYLYYNPSYDDGPEARQATNIMKLVRDVGWQDSRG